MCVVGVRPPQDGCSENEKLDSVCLALVEHAINVRHSADNISVILVRIVDRAHPDLAHSRRTRVAGMVCSRPKDGGDMDEDDDDMNQTLRPGVSPANAMRGGTPSGLLIPGSESAWD